MSLPADQSYATSSEADTTNESVEVEQTDSEEETSSESEEISESEESNGSSEEEGSAASVPATPSRTGQRVLPSMLNGFVNTNASPATASDFRPVRALPARATRSTTAAKASSSSNWTHSIGAFTRSLASPAKKGRLNDVQACPTSSSADPLDGEEGEVIDEGVSFSEPGVNRVDFLCALPSEISAYILLHSDALTLCQARAVSKSWKLICSDNIVWRDHFYRNEGWQVKPEILAAAAAQAASADPFLPLSRHPSSPSANPTEAPQTPGLAGKVAKRLTTLITDLGSMHLAPLSPTSESGPPMQSTPLRGSIRRTSSSAISPFAPLPSPYHGGTFNVETTMPLSNGLDWAYLYKQHYLLDRNWAKGKARTKLLRGHEDAVYSIQKKGDILISGSRDKTIKVWDLKKEKCIKVLKGHTGSVLCIQFDDTLLVSGSSDTTIGMWNPATWQKEATLRGHTLGVLSLAFNDKYLVSCSKDLTIRVWDRHSGEPHRVLKSHFGPVNAVRLKDNRIISASGDSFLKQWDIETGEVERVFAGHQRGLACVAWDGDQIVSGSNDATIRVWDVNTGACLHLLEGHEELVRGLAFDRKRNRMVSVSYDKSVRLWDTKEGKMLRRFDKGHTSYVFGVTMDCSKIISCSHDNQIVIHDFGRGCDVSAFI